MIPQPCSFLIAASLEDLMSLAEELRPNTQEAMKIEMAPWVRDYNVNMEDLYSELSLEKIENKPMGLWGQRLDSYTDMFKESKYEKFRVKKILLKGDPGMGKTTFSKKIGWDWARKILDFFRVVFVVFLKLVRPEEAIENVILRIFGTKTEIIFGELWKRSFTDFRWFRRTCTGRK